MAEKFQHLILTRFNVNIKTLDSVHFPDDSWMKDRFEVFRRVCYASIESQTEKRFKWLVFFRNETNDKWRKEIEKYPLAIPIYCEWTERNREIGKFIDGCSVLISSRLDNDDALHKEAVARVRQEAESGYIGFVNFINVLITDGKIFHVCKERSNPFISLVENVGEGFKTVWYAKHGCAVSNQDGFTVKQLENQFYGLRYLHGRNISNCFSKNIRHEELNSLPSGFEVKI